MKFFVLHIVPLPDCEFACVYYVHLYTSVCVPVWCVWCGAGRLRCYCYCYLDPFLGAGGRGRRNTWITLDSSTPTSPRSCTHSVT